MNAPPQGSEERQGAGQVEAVGEYEGLGLRVYAELLVMGDGAFRPGQRVARVVAQAVEELGEVEVEVVEKGLHGDAVGQGDAQQASVFAHPAVEGGDLAVDQPRAELLVGHQPFMRHGADGLDVVLAGQVHVAGADQAAGEVAFEDVHHLFLHPVGKAPAGAEVGQLEAGQFLVGGVGPEPVELAVELFARLDQFDVAVTVAIAHFTDDRQQRDLEEDHVQPGAAQAHAELPVLDAQLEVAQVEAEQAEEAGEVRLDEGDAFEEVELVDGDGNVRQLLELVADLGQVGRQVLVVAAAELPFDFGVGVVVQHRLHHGQLVEVGVQQVLDYAAGEGAVGHVGSRGSG
ncbi:hypothetical protein D3C85_1076040 [compost metagenome]